jgi:NADH-quinone oxidoreductase subunit M
MKFFLYTHLASVLILLAFLMIYQQTGASDFTQIQEAMLATPIVIWWLLFLGFAIKLPVFPFHTWLPDAHVEAPAPISVLLAGVLLKMGGYGLLRLCIQYMPETSQYFALVMLVLGVLTAFVAAFLALNQTHLKKMVAYSSISHMGLVLVAISTLSLEGLSAALFEMLAHAVIISPLFLIAGMIHHHLHSYDLRQMGGILCQMPYLSAIFMLAAMAAVGMPATVGFVGEFTIFISVLEAFGSVMMLLAMLAILGAGYFIWAVRRSFHGAMSDLVTNTPWSVSRLAMLPLWVYAGLILLFGLYPQPLLDAIQRVFAAGGLGS